MKLVKYSKWIYCAVCILFIALGVCLTVYPSISVTVMSYIFGAVALAFGIIKIVGYFADDTTGWCSSSIWRSAFSRPCWVCSS